MSSTFESPSAEGAPPRAGLVERCSADDTGELLRFRASVHGPSTIFSDPDYFRWMYQDGPAGAGHEMSCWVYRREGRISGQIGGTRVALKVGGSVVDALWALDGALDPSCRGEGILSALIAPVSDEREVVMATEVHPAGRRAVLRAGWIDLGTLDWFVRPIDVGALLRARGLRLLAASVGRGATAALRMVASVRPRKLALEPVEGFDTRSDRVWKEASPFYPVICRRDRAFLDWRFGRYPRPRYQCYYLQRGREVVGYAVIRFGSRSGLPAAYLVDFLCAPAQLPELLTLFLDVARMKGMVTGCCLHRNPVSTSAFTAMGFVRRNTGWPLLAMPRGLPEREGSLVAQSSNWYLTAADSDLDRPRPGQEQNA